MSLLEEVNHVLISSSKDILLIKILMLYESESDNINCYNAINEVSRRINDSLNILNDHQDEKTYNLLSNDIITYQELIDEFKQYVYPKYSSDALSLIINLRDFELDVIYKRLLNKQHYNKEELLKEIMKVLNNIPDAKFQAIMHEKISSEEIIDLEGLMINIRQKIKSYESAEFSLVYVDLLGAYFSYKIGSIKC